MQFLLSSRELVVVIVIEDQFPRQGRLMLVLLNADRRVLTVATCLVPTAILHHHLPQLGLLVAALRSLIRLGLLADQQ